MSFSEGDFNTNTSGERMLSEDTRKEEDEVHKLGNLYESRANTEAGFEKSKQDWESLDPEGKIQVKRMLKFVTEFSDEFDHEEQAKKDQLWQLGEDLLKYPSYAKSLYQHLDELSKKTNEFRLEDLTDKEIDGRLASLPSSSRLSVDEVEYNDPTSRRPKNTFIVVNSDPYNAEDWVTDHPDTIGIREELSGKVTKLHDAGRELGINGYGYIHIQKPLYEAVRDRFIQDRQE